MAKEERMQEADNEVPGVLAEYQADLRRMRRAIHAALSELGVPGPDYPAPVANAVKILREALG